MALENLLSLSQQREEFIKNGISEERLLQLLNPMRKLIAFYRQYPDLFVDDIKGPDSTFKFYTYQRIFLRVCMRHRYVYATFPRGYSKSFLSILTLMLRCILFPNSELFVTTGGKEQAASITLAKVEEICKLLPCLANEINWERGITKHSKDDVSYVFKNGSKLGILAARQSSRGQRKTGGLMEQCVLIDGDILNEVIIPTTNVDRCLPDGSRHHEQVVNKSQIYITTAGFKNSFAYKKQIELLISSLVQPEEYMVMGGTYETPIIQGLLNEDFVEELKLNGTYNEDSFDREYNSLWTGDVDGAFFSSDRFDKNRVLLQAQNEYSGRSSKSAYYVLGVDVGRIGCTTEVCVFKVTPQPEGTSIKSLVNIYSFEEEHFEAQAIEIKRLFNKYKARKIALDANGLGVGLLDYMVKSQIDVNSGEQFPPFGVDNDEEGLYKKLKTPDTIQDVIYQIKANAPINTEAYSYAQTQMSSGKIKMLVDEQTAKVKLMETKVGQNMSNDQRNEYLRPYVLTTILKTQMMNLIQQNEGVNIILKQDSRAIKKDKFSAFIYGLLFIKRDEERRNKKKKFNIGDLMLFN